MSDIPYGTKFSLDKKKISLNAHTLYWHKNFAEFNFAHSTSCSPGSSGCSSRMNTPRPGPNIECTSTVFARTYSLHNRSLASLIVSLVLACCMPFIAALASAMGEGDSSDDRGSAGSAKTRGAMWKYNSSYIKLGCRLRKVLNTR